MRTKRKTRSKQKRGFIVTLLVMVVAALAAGIGLAWLLGRVLTGTAPSLPWENDKYTNPDAVQIMVMGVDQRADDNGRSDTLMLITLDKKKEKASILSVPRDMRVAIEGNGYDKINHAFAYGGHDLTQRTLEKVLGTKIDHYIMIDVRAFRRMIDAVGGVDLDVEKRMYYEDPWDDDGGLVIDLYPGEQHLDGEKAMEYVRYRDTEGDVGRIRRQQKFMLALLREVVSPQIIVHLPELTREISGLLQTDMSAAELTGLATMLQQVRRNGVESRIFSGTPLFWAGISYWIPDIVTGREQLAENCGVELAEKLRREGSSLEQQYEDDMPDGLVSAWHRERAVRDAQAAAKAELNGTAAPESRTGAAETAEVQEKAKETPTQTTKRALKPEDITVRVVNNSGINGAAADIAAELQRRGFKISETVTGSTSAQPQTRIEVPAGSEDLFYGMTFPCLIVTGDANRLTKAELTVGKDYR